MKWYSIIWVVIFSFVGSSLLAQETPGESPVLSKEFVERYDSLKVYDKALVNDSTESLRASASMQIIKIFAKLLREPGAFQYTFDALKSIAILEPEDKKFKIFTWQLAFDDGTYKYFGVIQTNEENPHLFPLMDRSQYYNQIDTAVVGADRWIGALYYKIIPNHISGKEYYTLLGWNGNNRLTNKKYIDVLWFDDSGQPKFGYPIFRMIEGSSPTRVVMEYKKDAVVSVTYYPDIHQIYYDHLVSLSGNSDPKAKDRVPDGTLEAFKWSKNHWEQINMVEYQRRENGDVPNVIEGHDIPLYQSRPPR